MIHPTAIIYPGVIIGEDVEIGPYCIIGAPPENMKTWPDAGCGVVIEKGAVITGHVTIDAGVENPTCIGESTFVMKGVHIGHDAQIGAYSTLAPHCLIGGYVTTGRYCKIGMGAVIRNRKVVPENVEIGMGAVVTRACDLWAGGVFIGVPAVHLKQREWNEL